MIIKIDICEYNKLDQITLKSNSFKTSNSKAYITANSFMTVMIPDFMGLSRTPEDIVSTAIEVNTSIVKFVFVAY